MNIQELLQKHTNSEGVVDYTAVQRDVALHIETEVSTQSNASINEFKTEMETLKQRNDELSTLNKTLTNNESYHKDKIAELTTANGDYKRKSDLIDFRERAATANVDQAIIDNFIGMEGLDLAQVDLTPFSGKPDPKGAGQENPNGNGVIKNGTDNLFDFMDEE